MYKIILSCVCFLALSNLVFAQTKTDYDKFLDEAMTDFGAKAVKLNKEYKLSKYRWDYKQDDGKLVFSDDEGVAKLIAAAQIVGSYSTYSNTWMWSWANETVDASVKQDISKIKEFGEKNQYKELITQQFECEEDYAWRLTAAGGQLLKAKGAYRGPIPNGYVYFIITSLARVGKK